MRHRPPIALVLTVLAAALGTRGVLAQIDGGDRGVAAVDSSNDFEVAGVRVDVSGPNAEAARLAGWREAQRKAYSLLSQRMGAGAGALPDGTLDSIVSSIVVENEQIGPNRYVARLGVLFDRARTAGLLGVSAAVSRSSPFLVVPVQWSTGVGTVFEQRTLWQEAWARFRTGSSAIDYVRPTGTGPDSLLLTVGQTQRPDRGWWRALVDQYGASDVLMPTVQLYRQWPGGPVIGAFEARYGPDHRILQRFSLRVGTAAGIPALLDAGVKRLDDVYQRALREGYLGLDPGLNPIMPVVEKPPEEVSDVLAGDPALIAPSLAVTVQYDSPDVGAVTGAEATLRGVPGVASATTTSLALGGVSSMNVSYAGPVETLRAALEARGWQVIGNGTTLRIRRAAPTPSPSTRVGTAT
ncbi:heavy-metal-associated domain-containing protein [Sphingomonas sp. NPDC079357]|uniref:heavy-metal-associated domain-containing protein n=1 Tax=Sphingomonas sp. NPDC079357 TaxID=3364518 RepID=UPI003851229D